MKKWVIVDIVIVVAVLVTIGFLIKPILVNGSSMEPTLENKDYLIVNRQAYNFGKVERGDIVVFPHKEGDGSERLYIKRVIAVPKDHLEIKQNKVYINGELLEEDYLIEGTITDGKVDYVIPEGEMFVMGDNRENSADSRIFGTVTVEDVLGTVLWRVYPFSKMGRF